MYRPEGLKNPYEARPGNAADLDRMGREIAYEAGAEAMLEGLREEVDSITVKSHKGKKRTPGVWVFIPEEKE